MRLAKRIAHLGYGSRRQVLALFEAGRITDESGRALAPDEEIAHERLRLDSEPLDPPAPFTLMLHKPVGYTCSTRDAGRLVYDLLPPRFRARTPLLSTVGRLDRDTSGLLLMTDDGALLHRIVSPKSAVAKVYEVRLARDLRGDEGEVFASGTLMLRSETEPLAPARLEVLDPRHARVVLTEGRYHQVRRMFAALGNHVEALHRSRVGALALDGLAPGAWRALAAEDIARVFAPVGGAPA